MSSCALVSYLLHAVYMYIVAARPTAPDPGVPMKSSRFDRDHLFPLCSHVKDAPVSLAMGTPTAVATNAMGVAELQAIIGTTGPDMGRRGSTRCVTARGPPLPSSPRRTDAGQNGNQHKARQQQASKQQPRCKGCKEFVACCTCEESEKDSSTDGAGPPLLSSPRRTDAIHELVDEMANSNDSPSMITLIVSPIHEYPSRPTLRRSTTC